MVLSGRQLTFQSVFTISWKSVCPEFSIIFFQNLIDSYMGAFKRESRFREDLPKMYAGLLMVSQELDV